MCCKMTQNITYQKISNIIHGVTKNVSLDLVYVPAHKLYLILTVHGEIIVLKLVRNVKLKNVIIKQLLIKIITSNWNTVCQ